MIREEKTFNGGGLNTEDAIEYTAANDLIDSCNIRIQKSSENSQGYVTVLEGTREIVRSLPGGTNRGIGAKYFRGIEKTYLFTENSAGNTRIEEFDNQSKTFTTIFEDVTDTGGIKLLPSGTVKVKDIELIDGNILFWNHFPQDLVFQLNVARAKSGAYGISIKEHDLKLSVKPPSTPPTTSYYMSTELDPFPPGSNYIKGNMYQARYRYKYKDGRRSVWSAISNRPTPTSKVDANGRLLHSNIYGITIPLPEDTLGVDMLELSVRDGNNSWYTIRTVSVEEIKNMPQNVGIGEEIPSPNPNIPGEWVFPFATEGRWVLTGNYYYPFLNNGVYPEDDVLEHNQLFDDMPEKVRSLSTVNGDTILVANFEQGYPKPQLTEEQVKATVELKSSGLEFTRTDAWKITSFTNTWSQGSFQSVIFDQTTIPVTGDKFVIEYRDYKGIPPSPASYTYTVGADTTGNLIATLTAIVSQLNSLPASVVGVTTANLQYHPTDGSPNIQMLSDQYFSSSRIQLVNSSDVVGRVLGAVKSNSGYELAVGYYDAYGTPFPLYTNKKLQVNTPTYAETHGMIPIINWELPTNAPSGAAYYHILASRNTRYENNWNLVAPLHPTTSPTEYHFNITEFVNQHKSNPEGSPLYDFVGGDFANIISNVDTNSNTLNWNDSPVLTQPINGIEQLVDNTDPNTPRIFYILKVVRPETEQTDIVLPYRIEIVRPRKSADVTSKVFYEISQKYDVVGGLHSVTNGTVDYVDSFVKMVSIQVPTGSTTYTVDAVIETFSASESNISNFPNLGRPRTTFDVVEGPKRFPTDIRWSGSHQSKGTETGINRFNTENTYTKGDPWFGPSEDYGGIQYLTQRENRLLCIQEHKVGYIPVYRAIISDTVEQQQIAISQKLLNPITYSIGPDNGIGDSWAVPSYCFVNGNAYFTDPVNGKPVRAGLDGTRYITYKITPTLRSLILGSVQSNTYIHSWWDSRYNEWSVGFGETTYTLNEDSNRWLRNSYLPETAFSDGDALYSTRDGQIWVHDDAVGVAEFYGEVAPITLNATLTSPGVKTYRSVAIHADKLLITTPDGINTQLGFTADLVAGDFLDSDGLALGNEGVWYANLPRDNADPIEGDLLKGGYITLNLTPATYQDRNFKLLKVVVKSTPSTPNE